MLIGDWNGTKGVRYKDSAAEKSATGINGYTDSAKIATDAGGEFVLSIMERKMVSGGDKAHGGVKYGFRFQAGSARSGTLFCRFFGRNA
ncbi:MAG: hypothetical protein R6V56_07850 [Lentisphaeria bacterium]